MVGLFRWVLPPLILLAGSSARAAPAEDEHRRLHRIFTYFGFAPALVTLLEPTGDGENENAWRFRQRAVTLGAAYRHHSTTRSACTLASAPAWDAATSGSGKLRISPIAARSSRSRSPLHSRSTSVGLGLEPCLDVKRGTLTPAREAGRGKQRVQRGDHSCASRAAPMTGRPVG